MWRGLVVTDWLYNSLNHMHSDVLIMKLMLVNQSLRWLQIKFRINKLNERSKSNRLELRSLPINLPSTTNRKTPQVSHFRTHLIKSPRPLLERPSACAGSFVTSNTSPKPNDIDETPFHQLCQTRSSFQPPDQSDNKFTNWGVCVCVCVRESPIH